MRRTHPAGRRTAAAGAAIAASLGAIVLGTSAATPPGDPAPRVEAGAPELDSLDELLAAQLEASGLPALGGAIVGPGGVVALGAAGVRCAGHSALATASDRWHLGSCTKAMTATMIARLVERGVLSWDTTIAEGLPDLAPSMREEYREVTLTQLLSHSGGLGGGHEPPGLWARVLRREGSPTAQRRLLVEGVLTHEPVGVIGAHHYSNAGYSVAGHIAETITGEAWEELLRAEVFEPLEMTTAGFGVGWRDPAVTEPWGHRIGLGGKPQLVMPGPLADVPAAIAPAGAVHASLGDWAKFVHAHLVGEAGPTPLGLERATFVRLHTPVRAGPSEHGLGWVVAARDWAKGGAQGDRGRVLAHSGSNTMWYCAVWIAPERRFAVMATTNAGGGEAAQHIDAVIGALVDAADRRFE